MITVRFPSGLSFQYNTATYIRPCSTCHDLYTEEGGTWVASVPLSCIVESVPESRIYDATPASEPPKKPRQ